MKERELEIDSTDSELSDSSNDETEEGEKKRATRRRARKMNRLQTMAAAAWRALPPEERAVYDGCAIASNESSNAFDAMECFKRVDLILNCSLVY